MVPTAQPTSFAQSVPPITQHEHPSLAMKPNYMKLLSEKYGEEILPDGRPITESAEGKLAEGMEEEDDGEEVELSNEDSLLQMSSLKGERVDPHLRIYQVDKLLVQANHLTAVQRRSLVSRRNTAKLRLR